jgi:hypothetical protein
LVSLVSALGNTVQLATAGDVAHLQARGGNVSRQALLVVNAVLLALSFLRAAAQGFRNYRPGRRAKNHLPTARVAS